MVKALLKKEFLEMASFFFLDRKKGGKRNPYAILGVTALIVYAVGAFAVMIWELCDTLCEPLVVSGLGWVYFAFLGVFATGLACIGSIFAAKAKLFEAKDNETLLALPIPPWAILFARMVSLYVLTFGAFALVWIPALIKYFTVIGFSLSAFFCSVGLMIFVPFALLALCSFLGWAIAWLTSRLPGKNLLTVVGFAVFMVAYFLFIGKVNEYLVYVIANGEQVGQTIQRTLYPFWQLGLAACGNGLALLIVSGFSLLLFALVYWVLAQTFLSITTRKRGDKKRIYRARESKRLSVSTWLIKKECMRFFKNPMLFLNAGMGVVLCLILGVVAIFNGELGDTIRQMMSAEELGSLVAVLACFLNSSNVFSAASVSLEGENLWILRSAPISTARIFFGKISAHVLLGSIPFLFAGITVFTVLQLTWYIALLIFLLGIVLNVACACVGLAINLRIPNLQWTNEIAAVKQGFSAMLMMFVGWGASLLVLGGWFLLKKVLPIWLFFILCTALFAAVAVGACAWLKKRGKILFEKL